MVKVDYYIDGVSFRSKGVIVESSLGVIDGLKAKAPVTVDWKDTHGIAVSPGRRIYEARDIVLNCFMESQTNKQLVDDVNEFTELFKPPGLRQLVIQINDSNHIFPPLVYMVYLNGSIEYRKRWQGGKHVTTFSLSLREPEPVKVVYVKHVGTPAAPHEAYTNGDEWPHHTFTPPATVNFTSTADPYVATNAIEVSDIQMSQTGIHNLFSLKEQGLVNISAYTTLQFRIKNKAALPSGFTIQVALGANNSFPTNVYLTHDQSNTSAYQLVSIPLNIWGLTNVDEIRFRIRNHTSGLTGELAGFYVDDVKFVDLASQAATTITIISEHENNAFNIYWGDNTATLDITTDLTVEEQLITKTPVYPTGKYYIVVTGDVDNADIYPDPATQGITELWKILS